MLKSVAIFYGGGGGGPITRSINLISINTMGGISLNTDYVYLCTGTFNFTMPSPSGNTNRYTISNEGTGAITIIGTINGATNFTLPASSPSQYNSVDLVSDGSQWIIV